MFRFTLTTTVALALGLLVFAACGGGDDEVTSDELEERIAEAQQTVESELGGLDTESPESLQQSADDAAAAIREQADALADADVPEDLEAPRDQFVETLRSLADGLEEQAANVDEADVQAFLDQIEGLESEDLEGVLDDLRDSGLEIPTTDAP